MKGRTSWVQMFAGDDGKDRLVMSYNRYGGGAPNWNNLRVNGYDFNGIFVLGVLVNRFWRDANGDLIISQKHCRQRMPANLDVPLSRTVNSWRRLVQESHPGDGTYSPSEYEWGWLGESVGGVGAGPVLVFGPQQKNLGPVGSLSESVTIQEANAPWGSVGFRVNATVDENGILQGADVLDSWEDVVTTRAHGSYESSDHWADFETRTVVEGGGRDLVEVREVTVEDDGK